MISKKKNWLLVIILLSFLGFIWNCSENENPISNKNRPPDKPVIDAPSGTPSHGSNGTSITPTISWKCSDPDGDVLSFDVYFGKSNPPPIKSSGQSQTQYSPGTLAYDTKYYWKVVAKDTHGNTTFSDIWNFTTKSETVESISKPNPPGGPESGLIDSNLSYISSTANSNLGHNLQYHFDWGDGNFSDWSSSREATHSWSDVGTYSVRTQARCAAHIEKISELSNPRLVTINEPPETISIPSKPSGPDNGQTNQNLEYCTGNTSSNLGHNILYRFSWGDGNFSNWSADLCVSYSWLNPGTYYVKSQACCATHTERVSGWSDSLKVTINPLETVNRPNAPSGPNHGTINQSLSYSANGAYSNLDHSLEYLFDWGNNTNSGWVNQPNASNSWSIAGNYNIKARVRCAIHTDKISEWSNSIRVDILESCNITVTTPNSSNRWRIGDSKEIYWDYENSSSWAKIDLCKGGVKICPISDKDDNDGSAFWIVDDCGGGEASNYQIKITDLSDNNCYGLSESFTIRTCNIEITNPSSSTRWYVDDGKEIYWNYSNVSAWAKIELVKGDRVVGIISEKDDNDGSAFWIVNDFGRGEDTDYRIKVSDLDDPGCYDYSEYFTIRFRQ